MSVVRLIPAVVKPKSLRKNKTLAALYPRLRDVVYPLLRREPHFGPNIKRLKGEFSDFYRYRLGGYRLFYTIDEQETVVIVADLRSRQASYRARSGTLGGRPNPRKLKEAYRARYRRWRSWERWVADRIPESSRKPQPR